MVFELLIAGGFPPVRKKVQRKKDQDRCPEVLEGEKEMNALREKQNKTKQKGMKNYREQKGTLSTSFL